jgi:hypothetical protein
MAENGILTADPATGNPGQVDVTGQEDGILTGQAAAETNGTPEPSAPESAPQKPSWMAQLEKDLQNDETLTRFKSISELGKAYREAEGKLGSAVVVPKEGASAEEWDAFYRKVGRPEKPDDYTLDKPQLPEGVSYSPEFEAEFRAQAHKAGLTADQAKALYGWYNTTVLSQYQTLKQAQAAAYATTKAELKSEWGAEAEANFAHMRRAMTTFGSPELVKMLNSTGLANNKDLVKAFARIGRAIADDTIVDGSEGGVQKSAAEIMYPSK